MTALPLAAGLSTLAVGSFAVARLLRRRAAAAQLNRFGEVAA